MPKPECGRDCPQRHPGCQNPKTCETWRRFEAMKAAEHADKYARNRAADDYKIARRRARHWMGKE